MQELNKFNALLNNYSIFYKLHTSILNKRKFKYKNIFILLSDINKSKGLLICVIHNVISSITIKKC